MVFTETARYYDAIYQAAGKDYREEAARLHALVQAHKRSSGNTLLDVACGTGAHLVYLREWYEVEGVDLDESMLCVAREKLPGIPLHRGDMIDFDLGSRFDAVLCLFSSVGYVQTTSGLRQAMQSMRRHLLPGGLLAVEAWFRPEEWSAGHLSALVVDQPDLKIARLGLSEKEGLRSIVGFHYLIASRGGIEHVTERHEMGLFSHEEYMESFRAVGLEPTHLPEWLDHRGLYLAASPE